MTKEEIQASIKSIMFSGSVCINEQDIQSISPIFLPRYKNV